MNANTENLSTTFYFGLSVEVVHRMKTCSLVSFSGRDSIVDTDDLATVQGFQPGLTRAFHQSSRVQSLFAFCMPESRQRGEVWILEHGLAWRSAPKHST